MKLASAVIGDDTYAEIIHMIVFCMSPIMNGGFHIYAAICKYRRLFRG